MDIELVTDGLGFPEGPVAMADGSVILTDIKNAELVRVTPDGKKSVVAETGATSTPSILGRRFRTCSTTCHTRRQTDRYRRTTLIQRRASSVSPPRWRRLVLEEARPRCVRLRCR